jgi:hypothetical protein
MAKGRWRTSPPALSNASARPGRRPRPWLRAEATDNRAFRRPRKMADQAKRQRAVLIAEIAVAAPASIGLWLALDLLAPPLAGMDDPLVRLLFAVKCCAVAVLFCFVTGVEAVAHERLSSAAIDPLAGYETRRLKVNLRYLQHTLEQLVVFVPGVLGLAAYAKDGRGMRAVVATTVVWMLGRFAFWIGYHFGPEHRAAGAPGMALAMIVLIYVCARFGAEIAGPAGAAGVVALFLAAEAVLFSLTTRPPAKEP